MTLRARVALALGAVAGVLLLVAGLVIYRLVAADLRESLDERLVDRLEVLAPAALALGDRSEAAALLDTAGLEIGVQVTRAGGSVRFGPVPADLPITEPGQLTTHSTAAGTNWRVLSVETRTGALVQLTVPLAGVEEQLDLVRRRIALVVLASIAGAAILGWFVGSGLARPLRRLQEAARHAGPDGQRELPMAQGVPEVDEVAHALDDALARVDAEVERTRDALEASRRFAADVAHEVRTPLTAMAIDLSVLEGDQAGLDDRQAAVGSLRAQHSRTLVRLDSLRRLARGDAVDPGIFEALDLAELVDRVLANVATAEDVEVVADLPDEAPVRGWEEGLSMAVENLFVNARRHGRSDDGRVRLAVSLRADGDRWVLDVADQGPGVDADAARLFDRFTRGETSVEGSGLGLALVAQQARLHGGEVAFVPQAVGARVRFTVAAEAGVSTSEAPPSR